MHHSFVRSLSFFCLAAAVACSFPAPGFGLIIDNFEQSPFSLVDPPGSGGTSMTQSGLAAPGSLDGSRAMTLTSESSNSASLSLAVDDPDVTNDALLLSTAGGTALAQITLIDTTSASPYDLLSAGNVVRLVVPSATLSDARLVFTDADGTTSGLVKNVFAPGSYDWQMSASASVDYHAITKLVLIMGSYTSTPSQFRISDISVVPEPSALCVLVLACPLMARRARA